MAFSSAGASNPRWCTIEFTLSSAIDCFQQQSSMTVLYQIASVYIFCRPCKVCGRLRQLKSKTYGSRAHLIIASICKDSTREGLGVDIVCCINFDSSRAFVLQGHMSLKSYIVLVSTQKAVQGLSVRMAVYLG